MLSLRCPAPADFLMRRRAATDWVKWGLAPPAEGSRRWLVETCRAELDWAEADWRRLGGDPFEVSRHGPHPAEALRLPHERAAARLVNCHLHMNAETWQIDDLRRRLKSQRKAALDTTQSEAYRTDWAERADASKHELQTRRRRRAIAWRAFRSAASHYRRLRAALDRSRLREQERKWAAA
jgi:hypothetical protein